MGVVRVPGIDIGGLAVRCEEEAGRFGGAVFHRQDFHAAVALDVTIRAVGQAGPDVAVGIILDHTGVVVFNLARLAEWQHAVMQG